MHNLFQPLCLTVFLGGKCQLDCCYCYARDNRPRESTFNIQAFQNALAFVAHNCCVSGVPLALVFHGANEPLLYKENIEYLIEIAQKELTGSNIDLFLACTTNGVAPLSVIEWASTAFDYITLSWDGPSIIQDNNRPFKNGKGSSRVLKRTADVLKRGKCSVAVRATVTRDYCLTLPEIVEYFHQQNITRVVFSPVYSNRGANIPSELVPPPDLFAQGFLKARMWGQRHGMSVIYPGVRPEEKHAQFCHVLQKTLTLTSDGFISGCFLTTHCNNGPDDRFITGTINDNRVTLNESKLFNYFEKINRGFQQCEDCLSKYHCAKGCPSVCPLVLPYAHCFDCTAEKIISEALMSEIQGVELSFARINELVRHYK